MKQYEVWTHNPDGKKRCVLQTTDRETAVFRLGLHFGRNQQAGKDSTVEMIEVSTGRELLCLSCHSRPGGYVEVR